MRYEYDLKKKKKGNRIFDFSNTFLYFIHLMAKVYIYTEQLYGRSFIL